MHIILNQFKLDNRTKLKINKLPLAVYKVFSILLIRLNMYRKVGEYKLKNRKYLKFMIIEELLKYNYVINIMIIYNCIMNIL